MTRTNPPSRPANKPGAGALAVAVFVALTVACSAAPAVPSPSGPPTATPTSAPPSLAATPSAATAAPTPVALPTTTGWSRVPTQPSVSDVQFLRVVWTGTRFVATGSALDASGGAILDSSDGLTWNRQATESVDQMPSALAAGPHGVVAVALTADHVAAWSSPDGLTWTVHPDSFPAPIGTGGASARTSFTVRGLVATDEGWLAVGREDPVCQLNCGTDPVRPLVWTSSDGLTWTSVPLRGLTGGGMDAIARTTDGYVAVGLGKSRAAVWTSPDGTSWKPVPDKPLFHPGPGADPSSSVEMTGVAADHGVVVAAGMGGSPGGGESLVRAWLSVDGRAWSEATGEGFKGGQAFGLTSTPDGFLVTGPSGADSCMGGLWASADGRAWTCVASDPAFSGFAPYAAASSPSIVVAVGLDSGSPAGDAGFPGAVWVKQLR